MLMKTSVSLSVFEAPKSAPVLFSAHLDENIPYISEIGYDGVDLFIHDPKADVSILAKNLLAKHDLGVGVVMPAALAGQGLYFGDANKEIRDEIVKQIIPIIEYTADLGGMVSLGLVRGSLGEGDTITDFRGRFSDSLMRILPRAQELGVDLLIEPINRYEINTLNESCESYDFIKESGLPLYLMLDTFHMNIEDVSVEESLRYCRDLIKHVHFLDSNRLAPGMGHSDMEGYYGVLQEIGYEGYLCLEALSRPDEHTCAMKGIEFFERLGLGKKRKN